MARKNFKEKTTMTDELKTLKDFEEENYEFTKKTEDETTIMRFTSNKFIHRDNLRQEAIKYLEIEKSEEVKLWITKFFNL